MQFWIILNLDNKKFYIRYSIFDIRYLILDFCIYLLF